VIPAPLLGVLPYVVGAVVALAVVAGAHETGFRRAASLGKSELAAHKANAEKEAAELRAKAAEVGAKVVVEYRDRVKEIRVPEPVEVVREIEIIRKSDCRVPASWVRLHNEPIVRADPAAGTAEAAEEIGCAEAIEAIRENYKRALENAEQLKALQEWVASLSDDV
jgi:hypothetical protein